MLKYLHIRNLFLSPEKLASVLQEQTSSQTAEVWAETSVCRWHVVALQPDIRRHSSHGFWSSVEFHFHLIIRCVGVTSDSGETHHPHINIIHTSLFFYLDSCVCVCVWESEHVFMRSCTACNSNPACCWFKNTTDVQMFLLGKQTEQRPFSCRTLGPIKIRVSPTNTLCSLWDTNSDSLIHTLLSSCSTSCLTFRDPKTGDDYEQISERNWQTWTVISDVDTCSLFKLINILYVWFIL